MKTTKKRYAVISVWGEGYGINPKLQPTGKEWEVVRWFFNRPEAAKCFTAKHKVRLNLMERLIEFL